MTDLNLDELDIELQLKERAARIVLLARDAGVTLVTAESCTGGRLAVLLTGAPDASEAVHGGFVAYTKENKCEALGIPAEVIDEHGAVSEAVARLLAECALSRSPADIAVGVTGVAGNTSDEDGTPPGLVFLAVARRGQPGFALRRDFGPLAPEAILSSSCLEALSLLEQCIAAGNGTGKISPAAPRSGK